MPQLVYVHHGVRFPISRAMSEAEYCELVARHGFKVSEFAYRVSPEAGSTEYQMVLSTRDLTAEQRFARALAATPDVLEFRIAPSGN
jgi:putative Mg2+ transporter-C (MgtC) family protein